MNYSPILLMGLLLEPEIQKLAVIADPSCDLYFNFITTFFCPGNGGLGF